MSTVRLRRLAADFEKLRDYVRRHPRVKVVSADGDPPERYQLEYHIRSLRQVNDELKQVKSHLVEIVLPRNYPRVPPQCRMLSPVFHPNIAPHAICVGDHWSAGESLQSIVVRIGEMLAYQTYNVKSPLNGDAARWVEQNQDNLPIDDVSLLPEEPEARVGQPPRKPRPQPADPTALAATKRPATKEAAPKAPADREAPPAPKRQAAQAAPPAPKQPAADSEKISFACPSCGAKYKALAENRGRAIRCKMCDHGFTIQ